MEVVRTPNQCNDKWNYTWKDLKKNWIYELNTLSERPSIWAIMQLEGKFAL
jgi:hypothetical protein